MGKRVMDWLDLPKHLWPLIAKHLNTTLDLLRFRSICHSWRSSTPLPSLSSSSHSLFPPQTLTPLRYFSLLQTKVYRVEQSSSMHENQQHHSISSLSSKGWLIMIGDSNSIPPPLLDPFTNTRLSLLHTSLKVLNLMNFRFVQLLDSYSLTPPASAFLSENEDEVALFWVTFDYRKVLLFPSFPLTVFVLFKDGKLCVSKYGDEDGIDLGDENLHYDDIILHKGQVYVVDNQGTIFWINCSSFKLVQFSPMIYCVGKRKHLVENGGSLYMVDMYIEPHEVVNVKVYKLDEEWGKWLHVKDLGDVLFVIGKHCNFSLSALDYYGCEGNCVYFYSVQGRACAFSLGNSKFKSPDVFWPCPTLFHPKFNL